MSTSDVELTETTENQSAEGFEALKMDFTSSGTNGLY